MRFLKSFPGEYYCPSRWATSDGIIPYRLFWQMYNDLSRLETGARLETGLGVSLGIGVALSKEGDMKTKGLLRRYRTWAFPEVDDLEKESEPDAETG